ncbi:MAG TPA: VOC family protein [Mariprofundaceae bacterium]|nr:VOC family protein [Mariprofundaceae bacterium]
MKNNPVRWFEIYVQEMERAKCFYESVFHVELQKIDGTELDMWGFPSDMDHYGVSGTLVKMDGVCPGGNSTLVYFACDDCAVEAGRIEAAGGQIHRSKTSIGQYGFIALVIDTEGNLIGLHSMQ